MRLIRSCVSGRSFGCLAQKHADDRAHLRLDIDDENLFVIADKQRAAAVGGKNAADLNRHNFVLHASNLGQIREKQAPV